LWFVHAVRSGLDQTSIATLSHRAEAVVRMRCRITLTMHPSSWHRLLKPTHNPRLAGAGSGNRWRARQWQTCLPAQSREARIVPVSKHERVGQQIE
jgi:hypothetical protein